MQELKIENFKYGLDTRRDSLVSQPGTLVSLNNAHINAGGEIETRGKFTADAALFPTNTYGLQDTDNGPYTFGSDASPNASLPTGVTYQRLLHPVAPGVAMTGVTFSCAYLGKPFVIATYASNETIVFYDGNVVSEISDGIVGVPGALANLSSQLAAIINKYPGWLGHANVIGIPYDGVHNLGFQESALQGSTLVMSPPKVHFTPTIVNNNSAAGFLGARLIDQNYPGIDAKSASAAFALTGGTTGTVTVTAPAHADGTGTAQLTNGAVSFVTDLPTTTKAVSDAINNFTFLTGYSAQYQGNTITVFAPASFGNFTYNLTVDVTGDITVADGTPFSVIKLSVTQGNQINTSLGGGVIQCSKMISAQVTGLSSGGVATYVWSLVDSQDNDVTSPNAFFFMSNVNGPVNSIYTGFTSNDPSGTVRTHKARCTVSDSGNSTTATVFFSVVIKKP